jgi:hypothetical protein
MGMLGAPFRVSPFSFLRLDSCREQATKKTPDEEFAEKVHWGTSSFGRSGYLVAPRKAAVNELVLAETHRQSDIRHRRRGLMAVGPIRDLRLLIGVCRQYPLDPNEELAGDTGAAFAG